MRVVLDTNVLVSGIFFGGPPARILEAWRDQKFILVVSQTILDEYVEVAARLALKFQGIDVREILRRVIVTAELHSAPDLPMPICADPDDDKFVACAITAGVSMVVTGDRALLDVDGFAGLRVVTPRAFVDRWLER